MAAPHLNQEFVPAVPLAQLSIRELSELVDAHGRAFTTLYKQEKARKAEAVMRLRKHLATVDVVEPGHYRNDDEAEEYTPAGSREAGS